MLTNSHPVSVCQQIVYIFYINLGDRLDKDVPAPSSYKSKDEYSAKDAAKVLGNKAKSGRLALPAPKSSIIVSEKDLEHYLEKGYNKEEIEQAYREADRKSVV